jgi:hypothetical protein
MKNPIAFGHARDSAGTDGVLTYFAPRAAEKLRVR